MFVFIHYMNFIILNLYCYYGGSFCVRLSYNTNIGKGLIYILLLLLNSIHLLPLYGPGTFNYGPCARAP